MAPLTRDSDPADRKRTGRPAERLPDDLNAPLFREHPDGVVISINGKIEFANPRYEEISGYTASEAAGMPVSALVVAEDRKKVDARVHALSKDGPASPAEYKLLRKDGGVVPISSFSRPIKYAGKRAIVSVVRDISELKRAEEELAKNEQQNRAVLEAIPDMVFVIARDGTYLDFVPGQGVQPRMPTAAIIGNNIRDTVPEIADRLFAAIEAALAGKGTQSIQYDMPFPDSVHSMETRIAKSGPDEAIAIVRDISDLTRAIRDLKESERTARSILEAIPDMVFRVNRDGVHLDYIPGQGATPVRPAEELMGRSVRETLPEAADLIMDAVAAALDSGKTQTVSYELTYDDGPHFLEARISPSGPDEVLAMVRDLTDLVRLQEELETAREELEGRAARQLVRGNPYKLTFREFTVLDLVAQGKADKEIAADLGISPLTVHRHVSNILAKMDCGSRTEAGTRAIREGLVD